ncbi:unnamed protein product [Orchesella dallaii]|uniref:Farnesoate epoxidase n=1 Tax=Orchesella dallaii TaxID=48710 RepID=A0ABP1RIV0_9HEXA
MTLEFILVFISLFLLACIFFRKRGKLPPGPPPLPLIGNIHQIFGKDVHLKFCRWSKEYGRLYTVQLGNKQALVISDPKCLKDLFNLPASLGRYKTELFNVIANGNHGIVNTEGKVWTEQKNFCAKTLKCFGLGGSSRASLEPVVLSEIEEVLSDLRTQLKSSKSGIETASLLEHIKRYNCNIMWKIISSGGNEEGKSECDNRAAKLSRDYLDGMARAVTTGLAFLPWLKYIAPEWSGYNLLKRTADEVHTLVIEQLNERRKDFVEGKGKDIMDAYIEKLNLCDDPKSSFYGELGLQNGISAMLELVVASGETTPHTINWLMLYLAHHQRAQQKLCDEIDRVIGKDRMPSLLDRQNMPYYEAVLQESLRFSAMVWMSIPHELTEDIEFEGYTLPKGLILLPNLYYIHHDPVIWGDPEKFRPERFISEDGSFIRNDVMMPFGTGKRLCFGEGLARDIMFLFIVRFFQSAQIFPESLDMLPDFSAQFGFLLNAQPFKVAIKWRK